MMPQYDHRLREASETARKLKAIRDAVGAHDAMPYISGNAQRSYVVYFDERQRTCVKFTVPAMEFRCEPDTPAMRKKLELVRNAVLLLW